MSPAEWNQPGGNAEWQRRVSVQGPQTVASLQEITLGSSALLTVAFSADGAVYTGADAWLAFDSNLNPLWQRSGKGKPSGGPIVLSNGNVLCSDWVTLNTDEYAGYTQGLEYNPAGELVWSADNVQFNSARSYRNNLGGFGRLGSGDVLYTAVDNSNSYGENRSVIISAFDLQTHDEIWSFGPIDWECGSSVDIRPDGDRIYYGMSTWLDTNAISHQDYPQLPDTAPGELDEPIFFAARWLSIGEDGSLYGLTYYSDGFSVWHPGNQGQGFSSQTLFPALGSDGRVCVFSNGDCCCYDSSGTLLWSVSPDWAYPDSARLPDESQGGSRHHFICIDGDEDSYWTAEGWAWALDSEGALLWQQQLSDKTHGEIAIGPNGALYIPMASGKLVVIH